jgi:hypothetical protein
MKIFRTMKKCEGSIEINLASTQSRLELKPVSTDQYGVTTTLWAEVTVILIQYQIF